MTTIPLGVSISKAPPAALGPSFQCTEGPEKRHRATVPPKPCSGACTCRVLDWRHSECLKSELIELCLRLSNCLSMLNVSISRPSQHPCTTCLRFWRFSCFLRGKSVNLRGYSPKRLVPVGSIVEIQGSPAVPYTETISGQKDPCLSKFKRHGTSE